MKYYGFANNVDKYFNKYFCKYKSKTRFNKFEYSLLKRSIYIGWFSDDSDLFKDISTPVQREYLND